MFSYNKTLNKGSAMFNKSREEKLMKRELEIENAKKDLELAQARFQQETATDKEVFSRTQANWESINKAREERRIAAVVEAKAIGVMEGRQAAQKELEAIKDQEIALLKALLEKAIGALTKTEVTKHA